MFGLFKSDPIAKLEKQYRAKLQEARDIQRKGDVLKAGQVTAEAEEIGRKIEELRSKK
ncbi:MAG: Lacal_2735 family protein [Flavobacteriales bacterium]|nr:Lacal_2735 family protein [Flavobacteriales bacterium]